MFAFSAMTSAATPVMAKPAVLAPSRTTASQNAFNQSSSSMTVHIRHLVAGISGGVTSALVLHPLDLVKIRFQGLVAIYITPEEIIVLNG